MRSLLIIAALVALPGCFRGVTRVASPPGPPSPDVGTGYSAASPAAFDPSPLLAWASWAGLAGVLVLVALAVAIAPLRGRFLTAAAGAGALLATAYAMGHVLAWLPWISLVAAVVGVGYGIWWLASRLHAAVASAREPVETLKARVPEVWDKDVKPRMIAAQGKAQRDLDDMAHRVRAKGGGNASQ